jgi:hypothetical protein
MNAGKFLVAGNLFLHLPWLEVLRRWSHAKDEVSGIIFTGNLCSQVLPREEGDFQSALLKEYIRNLPTEVYYCVGEYDPEDIEEWPSEIPHLHLAGNYHVADGWQLTVMSHHQWNGLVLPEQGRPTVIASHFPPVGTRCSIAADGECVGRNEINAAAEYCRDARLITCGHVMDPVDRVDSLDLHAGLEDPVVFAHGNAIHEVGVRADAPSFLSVDLGRRSATMFDGVRTRFCDFAR